MPFKRGPAPLVEDATHPFNLEIFNENPNDQTFVMIADPGTQTVTPSGPAAQTLAWLVGVIPGKVGSLVSSGCFYWAEDFALGLGSITQAGAGTFLATVAAPMANGGTNDVSAGFTGTAGHGAPKVTALSKTSSTKFTMNSDGTVPTAGEQSAALVYYAAAWSIGEEAVAGRFSPASAIRYLPNTVATLAPGPAYSVRAGPSATDAGDVLDPTLVSSAYPVDFAGVPIVRLTYTASNTFVPH
ncbi:hypothetical protein [Stappia sp.]|uniref:hypothetical protein n=1 Tax=Stappia sp. TaxID=1870903 RepID=UPI0032D9227E